MRQHIQVICKGIKVKSKMKAKKRQKEKKKKRQTPNQLIKSIIAIVASFKSTLTQSKSKHRKEDFNTWSICTTSSRHLLFLSFQTVQKIHKEALKEVLVM